ncbi:MAG: 30S ribosome-binding factor RbfA [Verrucomicrobia bacterium]|nr:30S ribosome-binding factor RbfA [Verrucomicrobiota bacterium]
MQGRRHLRVAALLKRELSKLLIQEFSSAELGLISVNEVALSGDLRIATAYVGVYGSDEQLQEAWKALRRNRRRLQELLAHAVVLKYAPQLRFVLDDSVARGTRVLQIIEELEEELPPQPEA